MKGAPAVLIRSILLAALQTSWYVVVVLFVDDAALQIQSEPSLVLVGAQLVCLGVNGFLKYHKSEVSCLSWVSIFGVNS